MGAWGPGIFSDDLACDVGDMFRDLIGEGLSTQDAREKLSTTFASSLADQDESPVFWLALAAIQWKLGRLEESVKVEGIRVIDSGDDIRRWSDNPHEAKRRRALMALREQLLTPPPPTKKIARRVKNATDWQVGEVVGLQLASGKWTLVRTIGHRSDRGGRYAVCELLDVVADDIPPFDQIAKIPIRIGSRPPYAAEAVSFSGAS